MDLQFNIVATTSVDAIWMRKGFLGFNYPWGLDPFGDPLGYLVVVGLSGLNGLELLVRNCVFRCSVMCIVVATVIVNVMFVCLVRHFLCIR